MKIKDKLGYSPLLIMDTGYPEELYTVNNTLMPVAHDENYIVRKAFNDKIAACIMEKAHCLGFATLDVAPESYDIPPEKRVNRANANFATYQCKYPGVPENRLAIYIAFHYDPKACEWDDRDNLIKLFYDEDDSESKDLAYLIYHALINEDYPGIIRPAKGYILQQTLMCAIRIDGSFMDIRNKLYWMFEEDFIEDIADRILTGCLQFYGIRSMEDLISDSDQVHEQIRNLECRVKQLEKAIRNLTTNK